MTDEIWQPLHEELARRRDEGSPIYLWLRDDDAVAPVAALQKLIEITGNFSIPVALAVIPALSNEELVQSVQNANHTTAVIHGWNHQNHAPTTQKKQELGDHRNLDIVLGDLSSALQRMTHLYGDKLVPMLVPPWNRISRLILPCLRDLGYRALSCYGIDRPTASVPVFNAHVDLIDWHNTRRSRQNTALVDDLLMHVRRTALKGSPIGILTHHMVHDTEAWAFLSELFTVTRQYSCCQWLSADDLIDKSTEAQTCERDPAT